MAHDVVGKAIIPFAIAEDLNLRCGYERSVKLSASRISANRYMLGIDMPQLSYATIKTIFERMRMPAEYRQGILSQLGKANLVFLGFEHDDPECTYKFYLEFWDHIHHQVGRDDDRKLLHLGYKWSADDKLARTIAYYHWYPGLSFSEIRDRISQCGSCDSQSVVDEIVDLASSRTNPQSLLYLTAHEEHSDRNSFDINFYSANIRVREIGAQLERLQQVYDLPKSNFESLNKLIGPKRLGHVSGGFDRNGNSFVTIYYEA